VSGNLYKTQESDDFFPTVYVYRGAIDHKLVCWSCSAGTGRWKYLVSRSVSAGSMSTLWGQSSATWSYMGPPCNALDDGYHLSWCEQEDTTIGCRIASQGGCYVCPHIH
jgi:hypothetical protein